MKYTLLKNQHAIDCLKVTQSTDHGFLQDLSNALVHCNQLVIQWVPILKKHKVDTS